MGRRLVLAGGLLVVVVALGVTLLQSAPRRSGTDLTPNLAFVTGLGPNQSVCQGGEVLPGDTAALVLTIGSYGAPGPALSASVSDQRGRLLTSGGLQGGWRQGSVRIPVSHVSTATGNATVCLRDLGPGDIALGGDPGDPGYHIDVNGKAFFAHLRIEYMRPGSESWLALLPTIVYRFSLGKSDLVRHWAAPAALVLFLLAVGLAVRALLVEDAPHRTPNGARWARGPRWTRGPRRLLGRVPAAAWACALAALANGLVWSLIVPPFNVPDENAHYAYVQQIAERGSLPHPIAIEGRLSPREDAMESATGFFRIVGEPNNPAPFTQPQQQGIEAIAGQGLSARGTGSALSATANPPLYYLLELIPYKLASSGKVLDRLAAMRVLSALMGGVTVLLVFLFLRELLPRRSFVWSAGALMVAFQPLFGFMSGGVNNDNLLYLCAAGVLWGVARAFRRGLTPSTGIPIGAFLGVGLVAKLTLLGFIPAVALALVFLLRRAWSGERGQALRGAALTTGLAGAPVLVYVLLNRLVWHRSAIPGGVGGVAATAGRQFHFREELSHVWQLFLPPLWMHPQFPPLPVWDTWWFKGFFGTFGWLDYTFTWWVYRVALCLVLVVGALAVGELIRRRRPLVGRLDELSVYALMVVGLWMEIGVESYRFLIVNGGRFEQARYLLPLLGLYAAVMALAMRFGGRRYGPLLAAALVVVAIGHDLFAQVFTIARYYT
ncbi:MAG: DUF2142 domain-containing protein [Solirubrobacterales bacterium]